MIIGLHGPKQSGKDYFYQVVKTSFPDKPIHKLAFADFLKTELLNIFQLANEEEYDSFKQNVLQFNIHDDVRVIDARHVVREIGMMIRRLRPEIYNDTIRERIKVCPDCIWIITDVRFPDEAQLIKELGGILIQIYRLGYGYDGHITETKLNDSMIDYNIYNFGSLSLYQEKILTLWHEIVS